MTESISNNLILEQYFWHQSSTNHLCHYCQSRWMHILQIPSQDSHEEMQHILKEERIKVTHSMGFNFIYESIL